MLKLTNLSKWLYRWVALLGLCATELFAPQVCFAKPQGLALVAGNLFDVGLGVHEIIKAICIIAGASLLMGALLQYKKYRQNPIEVKLSTVVLTFGAGVLLIILAFIPMQSVK